MEKITTSFMRELYTARKLSIKYEERFKRVESFEQDRIVEQLLEDKYNEDNTLEFMLDRIEETLKLVRFCSFEAWVAINRLIGVWVEDDTKYED